MRKFQTTTTEEHSIKITSILRNCQCHERHGKAKETTETGELHAMWAPRLDPQHKKHIGGKTDEIWRWLVNSMIPRLILSFDTCPMVI